MLASTLNDGIIDWKKLDSESDTFACPDELLVVADLAPAAFEPAAVLLLEAFLLHYSNQIQIMTDNDNIL